MRIKKDSDSWTAGGVINRDTRHDKSAVPEQPKHKPKRKDTKKWCRGRVGKEHKLEWKTYEEVKHSSWCAKGDSNWFILMCTVCNKQIEHCWSFIKGKCKNPNHNHPK